MEINLDRDYISNFLLPKYTVELHYSRLHSIIQGIWKHFIPTKTNRIQNIQTIIVHRTEFHFPENTASRYM